MATHALAAFLTPTLVGGLGTLLAQSDWIGRVVFRRANSIRLERTRSLRIALTLLSFSLGSAAGFAVAMFGLGADDPQTVIALFAFVAGIVMGIVVRAINRVWH